MTGKPYAASLLLLLAALPAGFSAQAQSLKAAVDRAGLMGARPVRYQPQATDSAPARRTSQPLPPSPLATPPPPPSWGKMVGHTTYDLQTNRGAGNRVIATGSDVSIVWTQTCNISGGTFIYRGTGFNKSTDGGATFLDSTTHCVSPYGIASVRTGWPEIMHVNGHDVVIAHTGMGLVRIARTGNTGPWSTSSALPFSIIQHPRRGTTYATWPRAMASGSTVHLIYTDNLGSTTGGATQQPSGVRNPVLYARSPDGGLSWDRTGVVLPQFDSTNFDNVGGDAYALGVNGSTVAITAGAFGANTVIAKSTDGGSTFTTHRLMGPFTAADTIMLPSQRLGGDTACVVASDGSMSVVVDHTGTAHWFSGAQLIVVTYDTASGYYKPTGSYFPDRFTGLLYWNDRELLSSKPLIAAVTDSFVHAAATFTTLATGTNFSVQTYAYAGAISMPSATINSNGDVYCIYASGMRGTSNDGTPNGQYYRDLYLFKLAFPGNGTVQAYVPKNISRDLRGIPGGTSSRGEESVYPSVAHRVVNGKIHYQWMSDFEPGTSQQPTGSPDPEVQNAIAYDTIGVTHTPFTQVARILSPQPTGLSGTVSGRGASLAAYPNPTTGVLHLDLTLAQPAPASIVVRDGFGRRITQMPYSAYTAGRNSITLDLSRYTPGIYFCHVYGPTFVLTQRIVKY